MAFESISLRPSLGPVAKACPSAMFRDALRPEIRLAAQEVHTATGTALHAIFKDRIYPGLPVADADLTPYVEAHNVTIEGFYGIGWRSRQIADRWAKVAPFYQGVKLEQKISCTLKNGFVLEGTPDLYNVNADFGLVWDLKTGVTDYNYMAQVELYALILHKRFQAQGIKEYYGALFAPMLEKYTNQRITAEHLDRLEDFWVQQMAKAGVTYVTGNHCAICPRALSCNAMMRAVDPMCAEMRQGREITPVDIAKFRPVIKILEKMVANYKEVEKALLDRFGTIDLGDGYELFYKEDFADKLKTADVWRILTEDFAIPPAKVLEQLKMSKEAVKESARAISVARDKEKGLGVTQVRIFKALEAQGAVEKVPRKEVSMRQKPVKEIPQ